MKTNLRKISLLSVFLLTAMYTFAQVSNNNLVVFSQDGDKFSLIVNGLRQNEKPETNVKVTRLNAANYKVRVIFENAGLAPIDQNVFMSDAGEPVTNKEFTYVIANTKKGMKLRGQSVADITPQGAAAPGQVIYVFNPSGNANPYSTTTTTTTGSTTTTGTGTTTGVTMTTTPPPAQQTTTTVTDGMGGTNSSTTTTTTTTGTVDNANVGVNMGGVGVGININITDGMGGTATSTSTTTTTSSSSTTTGTAPATTTTTAAPSNQCMFPMSSSDFASAKKSVEGQSFEEQKLKIAKQILNTNCMSTSQIKEIMSLFSFEDTKVDWAEFAYGKTTDPNNYYQLNDGFTYSDSVDKLNSYIESHKH
ncbi:MAG: DUF4476 domain-containing protein [Bacteroidota bacterium]|nr:DUF4476 domain-containing protein [Bacteroidota bacterium]